MQTKKVKNLVFSICILVFGCQRTEVGGQKITNDQTPNAKCQMQYGITLIALIITVIILLILAGTAISIAVEGGGIFQKTEEAGLQSSESTLLESKTISSLLAAANFEETTYKGVKIPAGFAPTEIDGEKTVDEGLVIIDSQGNEYVWIEVPNDGSGPDYTGVETNNVIDTGKIYTALANYCKKDINGNTLVDSTHVDKWYDSSGKNASNSSNLNDTATCGLTSTQYSELLNKMLISVYQNGGFWIGRYEAGTTTPRKSSDLGIDGVKIYSKQNMYPVDYVSVSQAQTLAMTAAENTQYNSSIPFGIQWNLIMKFLNNKGVSTELLNEDSSSWGNYSDTSFTINRGEYSYSGQGNTFYSYRTPSENGIVTVVNNVSTKNRIK